MELLLSTGSLGQPAHFLLSGMKGTKIWAHSNGGCRYKGSQCEMKLFARDALHRQVNLLGSLMGFDTGPHIPRGAFCPITFRNVGRAGYDHIVLAFLFLKYISLWRQRLWRRVIENQHKVVQRDHLLLYWLQHP